MLESERFTFDARYNSLKSDIAGIREGINALRRAMSAPPKVQMAGVKQMELLQEEIRGKEYLLKGGLIQEARGHGSTEDLCQSRG